MSKRYKKLKELQTSKKIESIDDVIKKVKSNCTTKFNESIDVSFKLNLKQKKTDVGLRTVVNLPHGNGKKTKVAVLCEENKIEDAKNSGADYAKFQTWQVKNLKPGPWDNDGRRQIYEKAYLDNSKYEELYSFSIENGLDCFASVRACLFGP